jgi:hypothetical protein
VARAKSTRATRRNPARPLMSHQPGKGLVTSMEARFPATIADKLVCAKSVVQAVRAAHDSQALDGENYDLSWPLGVVIDLLEQASQDLSKAEDKEARS